jgi:conjugal transfer/entry exclusion protein
MKINGYTLRTAIRNREMERDTAITNLPRLAMMNKATEIKDTMAKIENLEKSIAKLQAFQTSYNLQVIVKAGSEQMSMAEAVKRIGGVERVSRQWRQVIEQIGSAHTALASDEGASSTAEDAMKAARAAANEASTLRGAINASNAVEIEIPELAEDMVQ